MYRQISIRVCDSVQQRINRIHNLPTKGNEKIKQMHTLLLDYMGGLWPRAFDDEHVFIDHVNALKQGLSGRTERSHESHEIIIENIKSSLQEAREITREEIQEATAIFMHVANQLLA